MIVIDDENHWRIIFQRAHAQLAADIAYNIHKKHHPKKAPFPSVLTAIADHDDGRRQWEGRIHLTSEGAPLDYRQQPLNLKVQQANKSITNGQYRSPWIGLLTSIHQVHLYSSYARDYPQIEEFMVRQQDYQKRMQELLNITSEDIKEAYGFMLFCDNLSLILCEERLSNSKETIEVGPLPLMNRCSLKRTGPDRYFLAPWCFKERLVVVSVFIYNVPKVKFSSDEELLKLLRRIKPEEKKWFLENR